MNGKADIIVSVSTLGLRVLMRNGGMFYDY